MVTVAARELRNHTADVLRQVGEGTRVTVTSHGVPVAEIVPVRAGRRASLSRRDVLEMIDHHQADLGLRQDLEELAGDTTDDLGPIR